MFWSLKRYTGFLLQTVCFTVDGNMGWQFQPLGDLRVCGYCKNQQTHSSRVSGNDVTPKTIHQIWSVHFHILDELFGCCSKKSFIQTIPSKPKKPTLQGGNRGHERRSHKTLEQWHGQVMSKASAPSISLVGWGSGWWWCLEGSQA